MMMKRLANLCFVLVMANSVILAQTSKTPQTSVTKTAAKPAVENRRLKTDEMREHQLRVFREHVLARALDSIKKMDEAGLRLSARNQILAYLALGKAPSDEKQALTTQIALEALTDLGEHGDEIIPFMLSYLSNDLGSWIQKHRPNLTENFEKVVEANGKDDASQRIRSLFQLENGDVLAAKRIRQELEEQRPLNGLQFWLDELMRRKSKEFEPVAFDVVARAQQGQISFETLFWVSDIYLRLQVSGALRNSFLTAVVARTQPANFGAEPPPQMAYDLLTKVLPFVQRSIPDLYDEALNQNLAMRASLSERQLAADARLKRLKESANPVEDLVTEADLTKSKIERNELLLQAAQLAVEKKQFDLCLDVLNKVEVNVAAADPNSWQRSVDQILKNFVRIVLADKRTDLAEKAAARIASVLTKVEALNMIMRYCAKANNKAEAQRFLMEAAKVAGAGPDDTETAKAFFLLSLTCDQVDGSKKADLLLSGIKALNNLAKPETAARDKTIYHNYVQRLDNSGYELTRGFKGLTKQDENGALALVEKLQKHDLRTFALIGILLGLDALLTDPI